MLIYDYGFTELRNTTETITSNNHTKKKKKIQGQEYDTAYVKGENQFPAYTTCHGLRSSQRTK